MMKSEEELKRELELEKMKREIFYTVYQEVLSKSEGKIMRNALDLTDVKIKTLENVLGDLGDLGEEK